MEEEQSTKQLKTTIQVEQNLDSIWKDLLNFNLMNLFPYHVKSYFRSNPDLNVYLEESISIRFLDEKAWQVQITEINEVNHFIQFKLIQSDPNYETDSIVFTIGCAGGDNEQANTQLYWKTQCSEDIQDNIFNQMKLSQKGYLSDLKLSFEQNDSQKINIEQEESKINEQIQYYYPKQFENTEILNQSKIQQNSPIKPRTQTQIPQKRHKILEMIEYRNGKFYISIMGKIDLNFEMAQALAKPILEEEEETKDLEESAYDTKEKFIQLLSDLETGQFYINKAMGAGVSMSEGSQYVLTEKDQETYFNNSNSQIGIVCDTKQDNIINIRLKISHLGLTVKDIKLNRNSQMKNLYDYCEKLAPVPGGQKCGFQLFCVNDLVHPEQIAEEYESSSITMRLAAQQQAQYTDKSKIYARLILKIINNKQQQENKYKQLQVYSSEFFKLCQLKMDNHSPNHILLEIIEQLYGNMHDINSYISKLDQKQSSFQNIIWPIFEIQMKEPIKIAQDDEEMGKQQEIGEQIDPVDKMILTMKQVVCANSITQIQLSFKWLKAIINNVIQGKSRPIPCSGQNFQGKCQTLILGVQFMQDLGFEIKNDTLMIEDNVATGNYLVLQKSIEEIEKALNINEEKQLEIKRQNEIEKQQYEEHQKVLDKIQAEKDQQTIQWEKEVNQFIVDLEFIDSNKNAEIVKDCLKEQKIALEKGQTQYAEKYEEQIKKYIKQFGEVIKKQVEEKKQEEKQKEEVKKKLLEIQTQKEERQKEEERKKNEMEEELLLEEERKKQLKPEDFCFTTSKNRKRKEQYEQNKTSAANKKQEIMKKYMNLLANQSSMEVEEENIKKNNQNNNNNDNDNDNDNTSSSIYATKKEVSEANFMEKWMQLNGGNKILSGQQAMGMINMMMKLSSQNSNKNGGDSDKDDDVDDQNIKSNKSNNSNDKKEDGESTTQYLTQLLQGQNLRGISNEKEHEDYVNQMKTFLFHMNEIQQSEEFSQKFEKALHEFETAYKNKDMVINQFYIIILRSLFQGKWSSVCNIQFLNIYRKKRLGGMGCWLLIEVINTNKYAETSFSIRIIQNKNYFYQSFLLHNTLIFLSLIYRDMWQNFSKFFIGKYFKQNLRNIVQQASKIQNNDLFRLFYLF